MRRIIIKLPNQATASTPSAPHLLMSHISVIPCSLHTVARQAPEYLVTQYVNDMIPMASTQPALRPEQMQMQA
jgi:hypothetical protein